MKKIRIIYKFILHFFTARNTGGFGIHSPYLYNFTRYVLSEFYNFYIFEAIERKRSELLKDHEIINVEDCGTGSFEKLSVANITRKSIKPARQAQLLFRIVNYIKAQNVLELGTSLGLTTAYLASSSKNIKCFSLEGSEEIAQLAKKNVDSLGLKNIHIVLGNIDDTLSSVLNEFELLDFVFIDANHRSEAVVGYFNQCLTKVHKNTILVLDDIYWSGDMESAWEIIKNNPQVTSTIDLFYMGIVFFSNDLHKKHYKIRI